MALPAVLLRAAPTVARAFAKPKVFKRFLGTRAGKRATLKYGTMLVNTKEVQNGFDRLFRRGDNQQPQDKEYSKLIKKYEKLAAEVEQLESEFSHAGDDVDKIQTITFKLGRRVVEMRRLLQEMEKYHQRQNQNIYTSSLGHTR